jgi:hypothetical protein
METGRLTERAGRSVLLAAASLVASGVLLTATAYAALGPTEFSAFTRAWLDDNHVWGPRTALLRDARRLECADPEADAERAIASGDVRLLPVAGLGGFFPGLDDESNAEYARRYGAKEYMYAGCVTESDEEGRFRAAAYAYAEKYNQAIVRRIRR